MLKVICATYKKNKIITKRAFPWSFTLGGIIGGVFAVLFPYFIYIYGFNRSTNAAFSRYTGNMDYMTYIVLGAAINILAVSILLNVGRALITEIREGTLNTFLLSPASRIGYFIGTSMEQFTRSMIQFSTILLLGYFLGAKLGLILSVKSLFVVCLSIFSFFSIGLFLSSLMLYTRDTYITQNTLFLTITLVCGISFPIEFLPKWVQTLSYVLPVTPALRLFRIVATSNDSIYMHIILVLQTLFTSIVYMVLGLLWFKRIEKKLTDSIFG